MSRTRGFNSRSSFELAVMAGSRWFADSQFGLVSGSLRCGAGEFSLVVAKKGSQASIKTGKTPWTTPLVADSLRRRCC